MNPATGIYKRFIRSKRRKGQFFVQQLVDCLQGDQGRAYYRDTALQLTLEEVATPHYMNCPAFWANKKCNCGFSSAGRHGASAFLLARSLAWGRVARLILRLALSTLWHRALRRELGLHHADLRSEIARAIQENQLIVRCRFPALGFGKTISSLTWSEFRIWRDRLPKS